MPTIQGFHDAIDKEEHFQKHGVEFSAATADDYETLAIAFLGGAKVKTMVDCVRAGGDYIRFDKATQTFAVCDGTGIIRTFFKPNPLLHRQRTNLEYFKRECKK